MLIPHGSLEMENWLKFILAQMWFVFFIDKNHNLSWKSWSLFKTAVFTCRESSNNFRPVVFKMECKLGVGVQADPLGQMWKKILRLSFVSIFISYFSLSTLANTEQYT